MVNLRFVLRLLACMVLKPKLVRSTFVLCFTKHILVAEEGRFKNRALFKVGELVRHGTSCSPSRASHQKLVLRTIAILDFLCTARYKLTYNITFVHITMLKQKCPTCLQSCIWCLVRNVMYSQYIIS